MQESLDESPDRGDSSASEMPLDPEDEPVLGPYGQKLLIVWIVLLALLLIGAALWLFSYLAYTTPPVPGGG